MSDNSNRIKPRFSGEWVKLGELGDFKTGGTPSRKHPEYYSGDIPWISTPALNGGLLDAQDAVQTLTKEGVDHSATKVIPEGSLMVGIRVGIGKVAINAVPMCTNQDIVSIVDIDKSNWNVKYLSYAIQSKANILHSRKRGATITGITTKELKALNIPVLPIAQQLELVRMLDGIKLLELNAKQGLSLIDNLVKSRFIEMFGDPVANTMEWKTSPVDEICPQCSSKTPTVGQVWQLGLEMIEPESGRVTSKTIVDARNLKSSNTGFSSSHVLYSKLRPYLNKVVLPDDDGVCTTELVPLLPKHDVLERTYLCYLLRSKPFVDYISKQVAGAKMPRVDMKKFKAFQVPVPPFNFQQEFAVFVAQVDKLRFRVQQQIEKLEMLKKSLMQEYFGQ